MQDATKFGVRLFSKRKSSESNLHMVESLQTSSIRLSYRDQRQRSSRKLFFTCLHIKQLTLNKENFKS